MLTGDAKVCTDSCEAGPFFTTDAPEVPSGSDLAGPDTFGERMFFEAVVKNTKGEGVRGAKIDVASKLLVYDFLMPSETKLQWQADGDGLYDVQYPDRNNGVPDDRGTIVAEPDGKFCYRGILPVAYPIVRPTIFLGWRYNIMTPLPFKPSDGPIGDVLRALGRRVSVITRWVAHTCTGRHPHRSSHLHFMLTAPGYDTYVCSILVYIVLSNSAVSLRLFTHPFHHFWALIPFSRQRRVSYVTWKR